ncbi:hypothetical protein Patl1_29520 [Pistacia atlantica]|uniref:Uncharacterized protein n=1 Tax=Pistacia atlantica TaxID=434234 RepID=A0ACC1AB73_9ROSI|nr:hypothetical protein Patl1_29520 [Pistacia atlantica]
MCKYALLRFSYYTAGTGGAGPTILATSFLLLGEEVVAYSKGEKVKLKPYSGMINVDFGKGIGRKDVFLFHLIEKLRIVKLLYFLQQFNSTESFIFRNLPEVRSAHEILGVPTVSARFGTAPFFWNLGMVAMTKLLSPVCSYFTHSLNWQIIRFFKWLVIELYVIITPIYYGSCWGSITSGHIISVCFLWIRTLVLVPIFQEYLRDRNKVQQLVQLFDPVVRVFDGIAGERVSMRIDLECSDGRNTVGIFSHRRLSGSVGTATSAFALALLEGVTKPGVWFPEEPEGIAIEARKVLLERAAHGTINFVMNKPPWMVETEPKELGLGIYV